MVLSCFVNAMATKPFATMYIHLQETSRKAHFSFFIIFFVIVVEKMG